MTQLMRRIWKRLFIRVRKSPQQIYTFMLLTIFTSLVYQNCGTSKSVEPRIERQTSEEISIAECQNKGLCEPNLNSLLLDISNEDPIVITVPDEKTLNGINGIDVSGDCDDGNFPANKIGYVFLKSNQDTIIGSEIKIDNVCDQLGRFHIQIPIPVTLVETLSYRLQVRIIGVDSDGTMYYNPNRQDRKIRDVTFRPATTPP